MSKYKSKKIDDNDLKSILLNPNLNRRGQYICDCPFCGKEQHFYISKDTQLWDCKKCNEYGSIYKLLKQLNKAYLLGGATIEIRDTIVSLRDKINELQEEEEVQLKELPNVKMPAGWKVLNNSNEYLKSRGVSKKDSKRYKIGASTLFKKYQNYILIPIYDNNEVKGFVGRYSSKIVPDGKLRYNNSYGTEFGQLLFGYDDINENTSTVILVEGIFDKIAVDKFLRLDDDDSVKCVCTFGKKISTEQSKKLRIKGVTNIILLYDFDAIKDIKKYGVELEEFFVTSITFVSSSKDIDECNEEEALKVFSNLKKPREFINDVIGKLK